MFQGEILEELHYPIIVWDETGLPDIVSSVVLFNDQLGVSIYDDVIYWDFQHNFQSRNQGFMFGLVAGAPLIELHGIQYDLCA